jgi:hypothetical protein
VDHACAALAGVAADVGAGQIEVLAQELDQERARSDVPRHRLSRVTAWPFTVMDTLAIRSLP